MPGIEEITCDLCGKHKANVLYYAETKDPENYKPKLAGLAICRICDGRSKCQDSEEGKK